MCTLKTEEFLKDLETIVNIDSGSRTYEGIRKTAEFFKDKYEALGFWTRLIEHSEAGPCLEVRNKPGQPVDVLFVGHLDTVFPEGTAAQRPFTSDGRQVYGPGVADMKSGDLLIYYLLKALTEKDSPLSFCVAHNSDEELGSLHSAEWLMELGRECGYCFVFEPGRPNGAFVKKRKGVAEFFIDFKGKASHAGGAPEKGRNAIVEMAHWICQLSAMNNHAVGTSVNTGVVKGGIASNVVPEDASCVVDMRFENPAELEKVRTALQRMRQNPVVDGVTAEIREGGIFMPMNVNEKTAELLAMIEETGSQLAIPVLWESSGGSSDANNISGLGTSTLDGCGPVGGELHSDQEYMVIDSIKERFRLLLAVIENLTNLA